jgi:hypothetical protein
MSTHPTLPSPRRARRAPRRTPRAAWAAGLVVGFVCGIGPAAEPVPAVDLLTITELTAEQAAAIRARQAAKPALAGSSKHQFEAAFKAAGMTPEQIDRLWREVPGVRRRMRLHWSHGGSGLLLPVLVEMFADTRDPEWQRVANHWSNLLHLPAVERLSVDGARALASFDGHLRLPAITSMEPAVAAALAGARDVSLPGVTSLPENVAAAFRGRGRHDGSTLRLRGITEMSVEALKSLTHFRGRLDLSGIKHITPDMAKVLHASPLFEIWLDGVESLSPEVAALLMRPEPDGQFVTTYRFGGLKTFPPEVARQWAGVHAGLLLPGDVEISVATARELAAFPGSLELGVTSLTPEVARLLAESPGQLTLSGLETLSPDVAQAFSHRQRYGVTMPALRTLEADAVRALCDNSGARLRGMDDPEAPGLRCRSGAWSFPGLETISADAAAALAETDGHQFEFWGLSSLSAEAAQGLAATRGWDGRLLAISHLSPGAARGLAKRRGAIELPGLEALDPAAAAAFGLHTEDLYLGIRELPGDVARELWRQRGSLRFLAVESLSPEAAAWISRHVGNQLIFERLKSLSVQTARALADCPSFLRSFPGVTDLSGPDSVAIVRTLADAPGYLSLSGLRLVSPEALAILRERPLTGLPLASQMRVVGGQPRPAPAKSGLP